MVGRYYGCFTKLCITGGLGADAVLESAKVFQDIPSAIADLTGVGREGGRPAGCAGVYVKDITIMPGRSNDDMNRGQPFEGHMSSIVVVVVLVCRLIQEETGWEMISWWLG